MIEGSTREKDGCGFGVNCHHRPLTEYDPDRDDVLFFGYVVGLEAELGYFTLAELTAIRGMLSLPGERDVYFTPCRLSAVKATVEKAAEWSKAERTSLSHVDVAPAWGRKEVTDNRKMDHHSGLRGTRGQPHPGDRADA